MELEIESPVASEVTDLPLIAVPELLDDQEEISRLRYELTERDKTITGLVLENADLKARLEASGTKLNKADMGWGFLKTPEAYQLACRMRIEENKSIPDIAKAMGVVYPVGHKSVGKPRTGVFDGAFDRALDETLLGREIVIKDEGPMDYYELWKLGWLVLGRDWRRIISNKVGKRIAFQDPMTVLTQVQIDSLRTRHHQQRTADQDVT
jgi:hypothetical protein